MFQFLKSLFGKAESTTNKVHNRLNVADFTVGISNGKCSLVDVRTPNEYAGGKIKNAKLINVMAPNFQSSLDKLDKEKPLYLYCRSGVRSVRAAKIAEKLGFKEIYDLKGGFNAWK